MIDIFKSGSGKKIIAIDEDAGIAAIHAVGRIMLIGTDEAMNQLRVALAGEQKAKLRPLADVEKAEILRLHSEGLKPSDIGHRLGLNSRQVSGFVQGHVHPVRANMVTKAASVSDEEKIDKIIAEGRKAGHGFVQVADDINRIVGGSLAAQRRAQADYGGRGMIGELACILAIWYAYLLMTVKA